MDWVAARTTDREKLLFGLLLAFPAGYALTNPAPILGGPSAGYEWFLFLVLASLAMPLVFLLIVWGSSFSQIRSGRGVGFAFVWLTAMQVVLQALLVSGAILRVRQFESPVLDQLEYQMCRYGMVIPEQRLRLERFFGSTLHCAGPPPPGFSEVSEESEPVPTIRPVAQVRTGDGVVLPIWFDTGFAPSEAVNDHEFRSASGRRDNDYPLTYHVQWNQRMRLRGESWIVETWWDNLGPIGVPVIFGSTVLLFGYVWWRIRTNQQVIISAPPVSQVE